MIDYSEKHLKKIANFIKTLAKHFKYKFDLQIYNEKKKQMFVNLRIQRFCQYISVI